MNLPVNQIICGDCTEVMKSFPADSIDLLFTSPPFKEEDINGDYWTFYHKFMEQAQRITNKVIIIIHSATKLNTLFQKYPPKRLMIWGKGHSQCSYRFNPILLYQKSDDYKINKYIWADVFGVPSVLSKNKTHPYQDPALLYETIIKMFKECNIICDPFAGSGTVLVAALKHGRKYIGIDISEEYCEIARSRIQNEAGLFLEMQAEA